MKVGTIDSEALAHDRDQLFAEAVHLYKAGQQWWPDDTFERDYIAPQQVDRFEGDVWQDAVAAWLKMRSRVTVSEVARDCIGLEMPRIGTADQRRISSILQHLGWRAVRDWQGRAFVPGP